MQIQAGSRKGKKLKSVKGHKIRPLMGRVKKSLFDIIGNKVIKSTFLDLFAGSGSVGIEALSRGSGFVQFVEKDPECGNVIYCNLKMCDFEQLADVFMGDVFHFTSFRRRYDLIFIGPPYKENLTEKMLQLVEVKGFLKKGGWIICQHHCKENVNEEVGRFRMFRRKKYGMTVLSFFK